jgi:hypothetical protein
MKTQTALWLALAASVTIAAAPVRAQPAGPVERACGGFAGLKCPMGEYCRIPPPQFPDKSGVCRPRPQICTQQYDPVCGVNHRTYGNACMAAAAGVSVAHAGRCEIDTTPKSVGAH